MNDRFLYICKNCFYVSVTGSWVENVVCPKCHANLGRAKEIRERNQAVAVSSPRPREDLE